MPKIKLDKRTGLILILVFFVLLFLFFRPAIEQFNPFSTTDETDATDETGDTPDTTDDSEWTPVIIQTGSGILSMDGDHDTYELDMSGYREGTTRVEVEREWYCTEGGFASFIAPSTVDWEFIDSVPKVCWQRFDDTPTNTYGSPEISPNMVWDGSTKWTMTVANFYICEIEYRFRVTIYVLE